MHFGNMKKPVMNLSIFVPLVACVYANTRVLGKLRR